MICNHNCGIRVDVADGQITKVRKAPSNPWSAGHMCNKAASIPHLESHGQRLTHPLRRNAQGELEAVSWDEAITDIAARLGKILDTMAAARWAQWGWAGREPISAARACSA